MVKIVIVEDDSKIRAELKVLLQKYGYTCAAPDDFQQVVEFVLKESPQLVLLDINLPLFDGYHVCRELRKRCDTPIIIVTSRESEVDELMSMNMGADDFITKPYNTQILLAHIAAILKRTYQSETVKALEYKGLKVNIAQSLAEFEGKQAELTKNELRILHLLMENKGTILSREDIMNDLWQSDEFIDDNTLTVNINRLRKKLEGIGVVDFLLTKRGQGYMI